jgi:hypothetical protein
MSEGTMKKKLLMPLCSLLALSAIGPSPAEAQGPDFCWNVAPFSNILRLRFLAVGSAPARYLITGVDEGSDDVAIDGSAAPGVHEPGTLRLGFSDHAISGGGTEIECNAVVSLADGNGTYWCWRDVFHDGAITGPFVFVPGCVGVPGGARGPDMRTAR